MRTVELTGYLSPDPFHIGLSISSQKSVLRLFGRPFLHRVQYFPTSQDLDSSADPFHTWFSISPNKSGLRLFIRPFPDRVEYFLPKVRTYTVRQTPSTKGSAFPPKSQDLYCSADPLHIGFSISSQKSRLRLFHSYQGVLFSESLKKKSRLSTSMKEFPKAAQYLASQKADISLRNSWLVRQDFNITAD